MIKYKRNAKEYRRNSSENKNATEDNLNNNMTDNPALNNGKSTYSEVKIFISLPCLTNYLRMDLQTHKKIILSTKNRR